MTRRHVATGPFRSQRKMAKFVPTTIFNCTYLLKREAANYLRLSPSTFRRYEKAGKLPLPVRIGNRTLYRRADLDRQLAADSVSNHNRDSAAILAAVEW